MSAILDKYRNQAHALLCIMRDNAIQDLQNGVSFRRSIQGSSYVPASTCEEIAMVAVEKSARVKALNDAIETLNETYRRLFEKDDDERR